VAIGGGGGGGPVGVLLGSGGKKGRNIRPVKRRYAHLGKKESDSRRKRA